MPLLQAPSDEDWPSATMKEAAAVAASAVGSSAPTPPNKAQRDDETATEITALLKALKRLESKHEYAVAAAAKKELKTTLSNSTTMKASMMRQSHELVEMKHGLNEVHSPLLEKLARVVLQQSKLLSTISAERAADRARMCELERQLDGQRMQTHPQEGDMPAIGRRMEPVAVAESAVTAHTIKRLVKSAVLGHVEQLQADRELRFEIMQEQVDAQGRQLDMVEDRLDTAIADNESLRYEQVQARQSWSSHFDVLMTQGQKLNCDIKALADRLASERPSAEVMERGASASLDNQGQLVDADTINISHDTIAQTVKLECMAYIKHENEGMMRAWGRQFDDLVVFIHGNLDSQRACIAEVRTSTFDHVDADSRAKAAVWNAQYNQLVHQTHHHGDELREAKDDQERSLIVVAEALVNLKTKVQGLAAQVLELGSGHLSSEVDAKQILHIVERKSKLWKTAFGNYESEVKSIKEGLAALSDAVKSIARDRETVQNIRESSLALKIDNAVNFWTTQFADLERRLEGQSAGHQAQFQGHDQLYREVQSALVDMKVTLANLVQPVTHQASDLETARGLAVGVDGKREPAPDNDAESRETKTTFAKIDAYSGADRIEFYDLTFASATE